MLDSVRTFLRKHHDSHPQPADMLAVAVEFGVLPVEASEEELTRHGPVAEGEGHFRAYDPVVAHLRRGVTLSNVEVRALLGPVHAALHQDRRFFDTADGHWYLADQHFCNDQLFEMLSVRPDEAVPIADLLVGLDGAPVFWKGDARFDFDGERLALRSQAPTSDAGADEDEFEFLGFGSDLFAAGLAGATSEEPEPMPLDLLFIEEPPPEAAIPAPLAPPAPEAAASDLFSDLLTAPLPEATPVAPPAAAPEVLSTPVEIPAPEAAVPVAASAATTDAPETPAAPTEEPAPSKVDALLEKLARLQNLRTNIPRRPGAG